MVLELQIQIWKTLSLVHFCPLLQNRGVHPPKLNWKYLCSWEHYYSNQTHVSFSPDMLYFLKNCLKCLKIVPWAPFPLTATNLHHLESELHAQKKPKWIIWTIVGQYSTRTNWLKNVWKKMSLFVRVVTHYGSNESNDSLGVFSGRSSK